MRDQTHLTPKQMADELRCKYGADAVLKASVKANHVIQIKNISGCLFWNEVLVALERDNVVPFK